MKSAVSLDQYDGRSSQQLTKTTKYGFLRKKFTFKVSVVGLMVQRTILFDIFKGHRARD